MGERCKLYDAETGRAQKLDRYHKDDICGRCVREGYVLKDVLAPSSEPQEKKKRCPSCRREFGDPIRHEGTVPVGRKFELLGDKVYLCVHCNSGIRSGADLRYQLPTREDSPLREPEGFEELFDAARALLKLNAPEAWVIPTLALAFHLCHGVPRLVTQKERLVGLSGDEQAWEEEADGFARRYSGLRPARVVDGVLILERQPVSVGISFAKTHNTPVAVMVSVYPHQTTLAEPEEVAALYDKRLSDAGIACDEESTTTLTVYFRDGRLELDFTPGNATEEIGEPEPGWRTYQTSFPHPRLVRRLYSALSDEFAGRLEKRERGVPSKSKNLVPGCVAFLLREYGLPPRQRINRLLDKHVLCETGAVLDGNISRTNQIWGEYVNNPSAVHGPLMDAARTLFY